MKVKKLDGSSMETSHMKRSQRHLEELCGKFEAHIRATRRRVVSQMQQHNQELRRKLFASAPPSMIRTPFTKSPTSSSQSSPPSFSRFTPTYCPLSDQTDSCFSLAGTGVRTFGSWKTGTKLLQVRLYEFAVYVDADAASQRVRKRYRRTSEGLKSDVVGVGVGVGEASLPRGGGKRRRRSLRALGALHPRKVIFRPIRRLLRRPSPFQISGRRGQAGQRGPLSPQQIGNDINHDTVPLTLVLKMSRDLPADRVESEYASVLRRRLKKVGGKASDPGLTKLCKSLGPGNVWTVNNTIRKGTEMSFSRLPGGRLVARVDGQQVVTIESPKLCDAFFDLYLDNAKPMSAGCQREVGEFIKRTIDASNEGQAARV